MVVVGVTAWGKRRTNIWNIYAFAYPNILNICCLKTSSLPERFKVTATLLLPIQPTRKQLQ